MNVYFYWLLGAVVFFGLCYAGYRSDKHFVAKIKEIEDAKAKEGHEVGRVLATLVLKDDMTPWVLEFEGEYVEFGEWSHVISAELRFDRWMERCGKLGMYSLGGGKYVNVDLVKEISVEYKKHTVHV